MMLSKTSPNHHASNQMIIKPQDNSPFFSLPLEIRFKIYQEMLDTALSTRPPTKFNPADYEHDRYSIQGGISIKRPRRTDFTTLHLHLVCRRLTSDLQYISTTRVRAGKPTCRLDLLLLDDALWVTRIMTLPTPTSQAHNVKIRVRTSDDVNSVNWCFSGNYLLGEFWKRLMKFGPLLHEDHKLAMGYITVDVWSCMLFCTFYEKDGYVRQCKHMRFWMGMLSQESKAFVEDGGRGIRLICKGRGVDQELDLPGSEPRED